MAGSAQGIHGSRSKPDSLEARSVLARRKLRSFGTSRAGTAAGAALHRVQPC
jgi:hypothetical protein